MNNEYIKSLQNILVGYVQKRINDIHEAEDLVQEVLLKVFSKNIDFCCDQSMKSYIFTAIDNTLINYYKKKKLKKDDTFDIENVSTDCGCYFEKLEDYILIFLEKLSLQDRELLLFVDITGKTIKQYSMERAIPLETAKTRLKRARKRLREKFIECCDIQQNSEGRIINFIKK